MRYTLSQFFQSPFRTPLCITGNDETYLHIFQSHVMNMGKTRNISLQILNQNQLIESPQRYTHQQDLFADPHRQKITVITQTTDKLLKSFKTFETDWIFFGLSAKTPKLKKHFENAKSAHYLPLFLSQKSDQSAYLQWLCQFFSVTMDQDAFRLLLNTFTNIRYDIHTIIHKLSLISDSISVESLSHVMPVAYDDSLDPFFRALDAQDQKQLYQVFQSLYHSTFDDVAFLRGCAFFLNQYVSLKNLVYKGFSFKDACLKVSPPIFFPKQHLFQHHQRWSFSQLTQALKQLQDWEMSIKKGLPVSKVEIFSSLIPLATNKR